MKKILTCLCLTLLLVGGGVQLAQAQTATQSTVVLQDQLLQSEREQTLKAEYQKVLDQYITQENEFKETRARYRRFSDLSLEPLLVAQAKNIYQLRDRTWLNYLNWMTEIIGHYADNGEIVEETHSLSISLDQDLIPASNSSESSSSAANVVTMPTSRTVLPANNTTTTNIATPRSSKTQKQVFLDQMAGLGQDIQTHYQNTNQIVDLASWVKFNEDYGERIIEEAQNTLYPIYSYTLLSQVRDLVGDLPEAWEITRSEVLAASANQPLLAAEQQKALNQLDINITDLRNKVETLENEWTQVETAGAYDSFREQVQEITTLSAQVVSALKALY